MARTRTDLIAEVLDLLGITQVGQDPSAEDAEVINRKIDTVLASLARRNIIYVQNSQVIDDEFFNPLAVIVANNVGPKFGQPFDGGIDLAQEALLREMQIVRSESSVLRTCYF